MKIILKTRYFDFWDISDNSYCDYEIEMTDEEEESFKEAKERFEYWQEVIEEKIEEEKIKHLLN